MARAAKKTPKRRPMATVAEPPPPEPIGPPSQTLLHLRVGRADLLVTAATVPYGSTVTALLRVDSYDPRERITDVDTYVIDEITDTEGIADSWLLSGVVVPRVLRMLLKHIDQPEGKNVAKETAEYIAAKLDDECMGMAASYVRRRRW